MPARGYFSEPKKRTSDKSPHLTGKIAFPVDFLKEIADWLRARPDLKEIDLDFAAWEKEGQHGPYYSANLKVPDGENGRPRERPAAPPQQAQAPLFSRPAHKEPPLPAVEKAPWE